MVCKSVAVEVTAQIVGNQSIEIVRVGTLLSVIMLKGCCVAPHGRATLGGGGIVIGSDGIHLGVNYEA